MAIVVRPAHLEADRELLLDALSRFLSPLASGPRFDWLYRGCPHGEARAWLATEEKNGQFVGAAAYFPRRMFVEGAEVTACVLGDFCIHPGYRSLGPALQLQRACLRDLKSGRLALAYDFPSTNMTAIYGRMGIASGGEIIRLAKPLRIDRKMTERIKVRPIANGLSQLGNAMLAWRDGAKDTANGCVISLEEGPYGEEFTTLAHQVSSRHGGCVERSADYLNWRYRAHPLRRHEILTARHAGSLLGYAAFVHEGEDTHIVDLFGCEDPEAVSALVSRIVKIARERGAITLSASMLASHPWISLMEHLGFHARESRPVMVCLPHQPAATDRQIGSNWFLMDGDRES